MYTDSQFAIDPTNPKFKKSKFKDFYHTRNRKKVKRA